jgi:two-component system, OmpR family, phosphate regulon response regulator OmpR
MANRVLIIDDDTKLRKLLNEYLEENGFQVYSLEDGSEALKTIEEASPDIVILDVMLPGIGGLELLKEINRKFSIPVIMLTAKGEETDRIIGLELGADDYIPKPFYPRELLARMKAVMRRVVVEGNEKLEKEDRVIKAGGITLDRATHAVSMGDEEIELSSTEYKILETLMKKPNVVMSRDQIMSTARGKDFMAFDRSIDVHISKLRAKLEVDPHFPKRIKTVWGTGYMFVDVV